MKVVQAFTTTFAVLAFLTLGSLLLMVGLHLLSYEDALLRVQEIYGNPWRSLQTGLTGLVFIFMGLAFGKMLIKRGRQTDAVILHGEMGPIVVSVNAIEDIVKKVLKRMPLVKEWRPKIGIDSSEVEVKLKLVLWSGGDVPSILHNIQQEIGERLRKILGDQCRVEIHCDVVRIEESQLEAEQSTVEVG
jgi:uncharacterized alkaline shock family protein YloU